MGALNCQKCINEENKIISELLLDGKEHKSRKVITSLDNQDTNSTPQKMSSNFSEKKINRIDNLEKESRKDKIKKIYLEIKNGNTDAIYDLDYNTLEVIYNDSDSYQDFQNKVKNLSKLKTVRIITTKNYMNFKKFYCQMEQRI